MWILAEAWPVDWLFCAVVCCLIATFVAPVIVLLLTTDKDRRKAAIAILNRHPLARFHRKDR